MSKIKNIILVHGLWADGSCYSEIIPTLLAEGYEVIAVQNPLTSLADDIDATKRALARVEGDCLLVGHSYGGVVITEVGNDERVAALVYIAAHAPDAGGSMAEALSKYKPTPMSEHFQEEDGFIWLSKEGVEKTFADDLPKEQAALIYATQIAPSASLLEAKVKSPAWKTKPNWYIVAENDHAVSPDLQRDLSGQMGSETINLQSGHLVMISHAEEVLEVIREAANSRT